MKKLTPVLLVALLAGCSTIDPYTGEQKTSQATKGAGIGAVTGALLGAAVSSRSDRAKGAAIGALVGGGIGGGIGHYMDQQEAVLRERLAGTGVGIQRQGDAIRLVMPGHVTFNTEDYQIASSFYPVLDSVALVLREFDKTVIQVEGFTDSKGSFEYNQTLSERRAASVANFLTGAGVERLRISTQGYGERYPVADNTTAAGRALNRRVEISIRGTRAN